MYKILLLCLIILTMRTEALSCRAGRAACIASCQIQNCATGYCPNGDNGVCVCSRCRNGPPWANSMS